jgi:uncharacterized membrane protein YtjA (UPF0391 family)
MRNILPIGAMFPGQMVDCGVETHIFVWHTIGIIGIVNQTLYFMLRWTITFLIIALVAAVFGFTGIAAGAAEIAKVIFYIFLVVFVISLIAGAFRRTD